MLNLSLLDGEYAVCRLPVRAPLPDCLVGGGGLVSVTRTPRELSLVCRTDLVPEDALVDQPWRCLEVAGPLDLSTTGVLAALSTPIAEARLALFAVSTHETDYLLVRAAALPAALEALRGAGHRVAT